MSSLGIISFRIKNKTIKPTQIDNHNLISSVSINQLPPAGREKSLFFVVRPESRPAGVVKAHLARDLSRVICLGPCNIRNRSCAHIKALQQDDDVSSRVVANFADILSTKSSPQLPFHVPIVRHQVPYGMDGCTSEQLDCITMRSELKASQDPQYSPSIPLNQQCNCPHKLEILQIIVFVVTVTVLAILLGISMKASSQIIR